MTTAKLIIAGSFVGALLLSALVFVVVSVQTPKPPKKAITQSQEKVSQPGATPPATPGVVGAPRLVIGDLKAKLTIIEYSDPQCPICKRFFDTTEPELRQKYIDTGKANLELRVETHIGEGSVMAGQAWYCANDQGKFTAYHDGTFQRQQGGFSNAKLKQIAASTGLDNAQFSSCLDSGKYLATVQQSHKEAQAKISGTPTFYIGSQKISGAQPFSIFQAVIDAQL